MNGFGKTGRACWLPGDWARAPEVQAAAAWLRKVGRPGLAERLLRVGEESDVEDHGAGTGSQVPNWPPGRQAALPWSSDFLDALPLDRHTLVMGIVNVTPDSFSDGGRYLDPEAAVAHGLRLVQEGADILDIGGESTRPGAEPVPAEEEERRVIPVIRELARRVQVPISIDTSKARVAERALEAGARILNDVTALRGDAGMLELAAGSRVPVILMHMKGTPRTMQLNPRYESVLGEVLAFLAERLEVAAEMGIDEERLLVDPGIGFGKNLGHNLELFRYLRALGIFGRPIVLGHSRKSFLGQILDAEVDQREEGTLAAGVLAIAQGAAVVRVHDVKSMVRAARTGDALLRGWQRTTVYVGIGSNLGDREALLRRGLEGLARLPLTRLEACSSVYETEPVGVTDQPRFLNLVVRLSTGLDPRRLMRELLALEAEAGRVRTDRRWGPRTLDLDLLLYGSWVCREERLTVPHPRMHERGFVLVPLAEIAPGLSWGGHSVEEYLNRLTESGQLKENDVRRYGPAPFVSGCAMQGR